MQLEPSDAGRPVETSRVVVERPPPGLARGKYAFPAWGIGLLGGAVVLLGLGYYLFRVRRRRSR
ncbi:MAG: hypothetical protein U0263_34560 [Polyangiaceae bacterium]